MMPFLLLSPRAQAGVLTAFVLVDVVLVAVLFGGDYRNGLARFMWETTRFEQVALLIAADDFDLRHEIAAYYFNGGDYDLTKSQEQLEELYGEGARDYLTLYQLARVHFVNNELKEALVLLNENIIRFPEWKRSHYMRGLVYTYLGEFKRAAEDFETFIAWEPNGWAAYNDLAWVLVKQGSYKKGAQVALSALEHFPKNLWLLNTAGVALWNMGDLEEAQAHLLEAKEVAERMTPEMWGSAYPGNNPRGEEGSLEVMREVINENLAGVQAEVGETASVDSTLVK